MKISFQKTSGNPKLQIAFFWKIEIVGEGPFVVTDHFIPELFYDFFYISQGLVEVDGAELPRQFLKTLHSGPITFNFHAPIVMFGARLLLNGAHAFAENELLANRFLEISWIQRDENDLSAVAEQISEKMSHLLEEKSAGYLLKPAAKGNTLMESDWLQAYSARHKRRLYKNRFGLSRKEMVTIQNVHHFLEQSCDFSSQDPHIIDHVNNEYFYDQPHLSRAFKKVTGFTLLEYFEANIILQDNLMAVSYNEE